MRSDNSVMHADDVGPVVGVFYGTGIREVNLLSVELREELDAQKTARYFLGEDFPKVELLPGEVIKDNIIRHSTAAEVVGDDFYAKEVPKGRQVNVNNFSASPGELVTWRPNNQDFVIIHEEKETQ
jgi:hypothetical protein